MRGIRHSAYSLAAVMVAAGLLAPCVSCVDFGAPAELVAPEDGAVLASPAVELRVDLSGLAAGVQEVAFYGRPYRPPGADFTIVVLPDPQYYAASYPETYRAQAQFIVDNRDGLNIAAVLVLGDIVDNAADTRQWENADAAFRILDTVPDLPYGLCVGNHDQTPAGNPEGTASFNRYFPVERYAGVVPWYGGHYGDDNDNHYILFSAGGLDFLALCLEYDPTPDPAVLDWANEVLRSHPHRRAIVCTHYLMNPWYLLDSFSLQGRAIYERLGGNPNLFLMIGGHICETGYRTDRRDGRFVTSMVVDYQCRPNGGDGWLRLLRFSPQQNTVTVSTYSPTRGEYLDEPLETDYFQFDYDMADATPAAEIARVRAQAGQTAAAVWSGLAPGQTYEWWVAVSECWFTRFSRASHFVLTAP